MNTVRTPFVVVAKQRASDTRLPSETVSVCAGVPAVMRRYLGITTSTSCPSCTSARGRAPTTSASPPVLAKGTASDATIRIRTGQPYRTAAGQHEPEREHEPGTEHLEV